MFCCHGIGCSGLHMYTKFNCLITIMLDCVFIGYGRLTNMQGCHGNCNGGLNVCAKYHG